MNKNPPPTPNEVKIYQWWWSIPDKGYGEPHILQLDLNERGEIIIIDNIGTTGSTLFDPDDWPGDWAVAHKPNTLVNIGPRLMRPSVKIGFTLAWITLGWLVYSFVTG